MTEDDLPQNMATMEEFEELVELLRNRGDVKLGEFLYNALKEEYNDTGGIAGLETSEMLEAVREYESEENQETGCVACGDGVDSADELQEILAEKGGE